MATKLGMVLNTKDPVNTLQIQLYQVNAVQVQKVTSIADIDAQLIENAAQITSLQAQQAALQTQRTQFVTYLASIGVADLTAPLTSAQVTTITAAGYAAP